ncbi:unnamed protein product [Cylindrotheca closterium]|uniref:Uncharacterized protein n=1 Tax=Cylindrotheca closterium TaxID=2856 RepID=A0AAD2CUM0_9STRA|nr:unnamed protein product [Cylindrotheca closterium]
MMPNPPPVNPSYQPQNQPVSHNYVEEDGVPNFKAQTKDPTSRQFMGAAVAGGVAGTMVGGPIVGIAAAAAAAAATTAPGKGGSVARSGGEGVAKLGDKAKALDEKHHLQDKAKAQAQRGVEKAKEMDEKHNLTDKAKASMSKTVDKAKEINREHEITNKAKKGLAKGFNKAKEVDKKHNFSGKAAKGMMKGATWVVKKSTSTKS